MIILSEVLLETRDSYGTYGTVSIYGSAARIRGSEPCTYINKVERKNKIRTVCNRGCYISPDTIRERFIRYLGIVVIACIFKCVRIRGSVKLKIKKRDKDYY